MPLTPTQQAAITAAATAAFNRALDYKIRREIVETIKLARPTGASEPIVHNRLVLGYLRGDKTAVFVAPGTNEIVNGWYVTRFRIGPDSGESQGVNRKWTYIVQFAYQHALGDNTESSEDLFGHEVDQAVAGFDAVKSFAGCPRTPIQGATTLEANGDRSIHIFTGTIEIAPNYC